MGYSGATAAVYDAPTMRSCSPSSAAFVGTLAVLLAPLGAYGAQAPAASPALTLSLTRVVGAEAVAFSGNAPPSQPLEAAIYATFSQDLPTVLLSRRPLVADAAGHYNGMLPIAPAFFRNAIVTVIVRTPTTGAVAQASLFVTAPNVPAPPDSIPPSVR